MKVKSFSQYYFDLNVMLLKGEIPQEVFQERLCNYYNLVCEHKFVPYQITEMFHGWKIVEKSNMNSHFQIMMGNQEKAEAIGFENSDYILYGNGNQVRVGYLPLNNDHFIIDCQKAKIELEFKSEIKERFKI